MFITTSFKNISSEILRVWKNETGSQRDTIKRPWAGMLVLNQLDSIIVAAHLLFPSRKKFFYPNIWIESWPPFSAFTRFRFYGFSLFQFLLFCFRVFTIAISIFASSTPVKPCPFISMDVIVFRDWKTENAKRQNRKSVPWSLYFRHCLLDIKVKPHHHTFGMKYMWVSGMKYMCRFSHRKLWLILLQDVAISEETRVWQMWRMWF